MKEKKLSTLDKAKEMNDLLHVGNDFVVLDIETTALSPEKGGMIIEIGAVKVRDNQIVDTFSSLINPERKIYGKTTELTGITNDMVIGKPVYGQVLPDFFRFLGNAIVVAHNSSFDWDRYLLHFFPKVGIYPTNKVIDTLALSKLYFPNHERHTLDEMCRTFDISLENHHRALDDSMATAELMIKFKEKFATNLYNTSYSLEGEQIDLFNLSFDTNETKQENTEAKYENNQNENTESSEQKKQYKIKRIKYWEKEAGKNKVLRRIYVSFGEGTAYFDIHTRTWYNKDIKETVNFESLKNVVLEYLNLKTVDDLCDYRN